MLLEKCFVYVCPSNDILPEGTSRSLTAAASSLHQSVFSTELRAVTQVLASECVGW